MLIHVRKALPQIGTQEPDVVTMDTAYLETSGEFDHQERHTRLEREAFVVSNIYYNIQLTSALATDKKFIDIRLDVSLQR